MKSRFNVFVASRLRSTNALIQVLSLCALTAYSCAALSDEAGLVGHWNFYVPTTRGVELVEVEVSGASGNYQGVFSGENDKVDLQNIEIDGDTFSFDQEVRKFFNTFTLAYSGTVEDNRIKGFVDTPMGPKSFRAERQ